jgi:ribosomal protein S18 acetylase RimI-like enzyme
MISIKLVTDHSELQGIRNLQENNLLKNLSPSEAKTEGFVTAEYTLEFLETMHASRPSVIAKAGDQVVGFAIVSLPSVRGYHGLLGELFNAIDKIKYKDRLLKDTRYVVVGQLCVAKKYRGMGLVQQMYQHFKNSLSGDFEYCVTDVAQDNPRSLKAHRKTGFQVVDTLAYGGFGWDIILWDWNV